MKKIIYEELKSTQTEARTRVQTNIKPFVVMAYQQTNGYGKYGRTWHSYKGNFAATFVVDLIVSNYDFGKIPMLICIKICHILASLTSNLGVFQIKWPNDIYLNRKKIGGILIERIDNSFLIGVGLNLMHAPPTEEMLYPVGNVLDETGVRVIALDVLNELSDYFDQFNRLVLECDAAELRQTYMTHLTGIGHEIKVVTRNETLIGVLQDINQDGALVLNSNGTSKLIYSADIFI
jgi:BirA family biotin operon repressor/biotin-[acetyl-CoA-carboxylase] ligase